MSDNVLISTEGLSVGYRIGKGCSTIPSQAVDNVSIEIEGVVFGLVGNLARERPRSAVLWRGAYPGGTAD